MRKRYLFAVMVAMMLIGFSQVATVEASTVAVEQKEPYKEDEHMVWFRADKYGNEYFDRKSIAYQRFETVNVKGTISENLTLYMANKRSLGYVKSGVEINVLSKSEEWTMINLDKKRFFLRTEELDKVFEQTGFVYDIKPMNNITMYITKDTVIREEPNKEGKEIGTLEFGDKVTVTGSVVTNRSVIDWTQIAYNGGNGYVRKKDISIIKPKPTSTPTPTPTSTPTPTPTPTNTPTPVPTKLPELSEQEKKAEAMKVAMKIANSVLSTYPCESDWVKVNAASNIVAQFCSNCTYTMEGKDYGEAYGVFIKGEFSCAGATRALGMVLECMGYEWEHANPGAYAHQWCIIEMDGQKGWADGQGGFAAYGVHPMSLGVPVTIQMNGMPKAMDENGNYIPNIPPMVEEPEYNPTKIKQQVDEVIKASGKHLVIVWAAENSLKTENIKYLKTEYSSEELVLLDLNQLMRKAGLYTLMEYMAITVEKENAGEVTYPQE